MSINLPIGLIRIAWVEKHNLDTNIVTISFDATSSTSQEVEFSPTYYSAGGGFIGGHLKPNTRVLLSEGTGSKWYITGILPSLPDTNDASNVPTIPENSLLIQTNSNTKLLLDQENVISGSDSSYTNINTVLKSLIDKFEYKSEFTLGSREISGAILRNKKSKVFGTALSDYNLFSDEHNFESSVNVGLDPNYSISHVNTSRTSKNLPFTEKREIVYEFAYLNSDAEVLDDFSENAKYSGTTVKSLTNRRSSRADSLSLSLSYPNFLLETIKGTAVDLFGNILDLNRYPINLANSSFSKKQNPADAFLELRALERKSIAFHFEINSRKDFKSLGFAQLSDLVNDTSNYSRSKSRFSLDVDKEGQLKVNVPASSEYGNIPILTRYENYSDYVENSTRANEFLFSQDLIDIYHSSFAYNGGTITIKDGDAEYGVKDRFSNKAIKHGTVYHDVVSSGDFFQSGSVTIAFDNSIPAITALKSIPKLTNVVSKEINISGTNANAGGRSGLFNFDGSVEFNVGANTVDRQSLWIDTAGGMVANIGKDKNSTSSLLTLDGSMYLQIGGKKEITSDSRFSSTQKNTVPAYTGVLDIRVQTKSGIAMLRIDDNGISIMSPGNLAINSSGDMSITSSNKISIISEQIYINERLVNKFPNTSI